MTSANRFGISLITFFLLSAIVFAFNATPTTVAIDDDSESQISSVISAGQRLPTLYVFILGTMGLLLILKAFWGEATSVPAPEHDEEVLMSRIARGPPIWVIPLLSIV